MDKLGNYKSLQANRSEMESAIANVTIDLDKETIRKGSPHILRLTKSTNSYKVELKKIEAGLCFVATVGVEVGYPRNRIFE